MKQKRLLTMLALLMMAVTGAWADSFSADAYAANATLNGVSVTANQTVTINEGVTVTVNNGLSIQSNATLTVTGGGTLVVNGANGADGQNEYFGTDPDNGDEVMLKATPGGDGNSGIVIDNGGNLIIINATIIAVGGKGGQGGKNDDNSYAANGADGNGFASFPAIEGAVLSYSTNGTDYTEYASGDKTLYRYMKAVAAAAASTYSVTLAEGTEDADQWTIEPKTGLKGGETVTATYSGEKKVKSVKAVKKATTSSQLSAATTDDIGKVVCAAGHLHDAKTAVPDGCTAVGILGKVTTTGHGLIIALKNAAQQNWNTINGWNSVTDYAGTTLIVLPDNAARGTYLTSYTTLGETTVSNWAVAQKSDYEAIFENLGSMTGNDKGKTYDDNVNAYITTGVGGTAISGYCWSATEVGGNYAWYFRSGKWSNENKGQSYMVRPVLGF